jgi:hypothetical protein
MTSPLCFCAKSSDESPLHFHPVACHLLDVAHVCPPPGTFIHGVEPTTAFGFGHDRTHEQALIHPERSRHSVTQLS